MISIICIFSGIIGPLVIFLIIIRNSNLNNEDQEQDSKFE